MHERDFRSYCDALVRASQNGEQRWAWVHKGDRSYIRLEKKYTPRKPKRYVDGDAMKGFLEAQIVADPACASASDSGRILSFEYHVLYNESYEVPSLLFNIYEEGGERLNLEEAWNTLNICEIVPSKEMYHSITMLHHPILFQPYLNLHPCKTSELMASLSSSLNPIISFLTTYGPFVNLELHEVCFQLLRSK
ncbi:ubiquitin-like-conjugating enzyme ATG10 [Anopheles maculipalpis]|uniref:ubiquitin-like-conjugating enzyme ATG10 n=1 Tax=Anopheles maculipalpis TaxID=1496333 RepID=UPI0021592144|nr:ubiquitin-like-conjugating enzyme ATG10 [Anopheles maculipalpis]